MYKEILMLLCAYYYYIITIIIIIIVENEYVSNHWCNCINLWLTLCYKGVNQALKLYKEMLMLLCVYHGFFR